MGSPEMVPIPAASGDGLLTPTADGSVAPDTVPRAAHPGGEQQVMCVCVCVCVCLGLRSPLRTWYPPTQFKAAFKWLGVGFAELQLPEPGCTP